MEFASPSFVEVAGRRLAHDEVRPAQPRGTIFLLTGLGSKRQGWRNQLPVFGKEYRTLAVDFRDVGDSDRVDQPYTVADLADDVAGMARALQIPRVHVIGISLGGYVAQNVALRHPDQVEKAILVSTSAGGATHIMPEASVLALLTMQTGVGADERARSVYSRIMSPAYIGTHPEALDQVAEVALPSPLHARDLSAPARRRALTGCLSAGRNYRRADAGDSRRRRPARSAGKWRVSRAQHSWREAHRLPRCRTYPHSRVRRGVRPRRAGFPERGRSTGGAG